MEKGEVQKEVWGGGSYTYSVFATRDDKRVWGLLTPFPVAMCLKVFARGRNLHRFVLSLTSPSESRVTDSKVFVIEIQ